jgi:hypothetical protein
VIFASFFEPEENAKASEHYDDDMFELTTGRRSTCFHCAAPRYLTMKKSQTGDHSFTIECTIQPGVIAAVHIEE